MTTTMTSTSPAERRVAPRHRCHITVLTGARLHEVPVRDLTAQGIGFILDHQLEPGTDVCVEMFSPSSGAFLLRGGRVIHATQQSDGAWLTGTLFPQPLIDADLVALLSE